MRPFLSKQARAVVKIATSPEGSRNDSQLPPLGMGGRPCTEVGPFPRKPQGPPGACLPAINQHIYGNLPHLPCLEPCVALTLVLCAVRPHGVMWTVAPDRVAHSNRHGVFHNITFLGPIHPQKADSWRKSQPPHSVTLDQSVNLMEPQLSHLCNGDNVPP